MSRCATGSGVEIAIADVGDRRGRRARRGGASTPRSTPDAARRPVATSCGRPARACPSRGSPTLAHARGRARRRRRRPGGRARSRSSVADLGVDFYAVPGQKWLLGPEGMGALWATARASSPTAGRRTPAGSPSSASRRPTAGPAAGRPPVRRRLPPAVGRRARPELRLAVDVHRAAVDPRARPARWRARPPSAWRRSRASSSSRRATGWRRSSPSGSPAGTRGDGARRARQPDVRDRPDDPGARRHPPERRLLDDGGGDRARRRGRRAARRATRRETLPPRPRADDPRAGRPALTASRPPAVRRRSWARGPLAPVPNAPRPVVRAVLSSLVVASCWGSVTSPTTSRSSAARRCPAATCGCSYLALDVAIVLVVGSVVTWLVVPQPTRLGRRARRARRGAPRSGSSRPSRSPISCSWSSSRCSSRSSADPRGSARSAVGRRCAADAPLRVQGPQWTVAHRTIPRYCRVDIIRCRAAGHRTARGLIRGDRGAARRAAQAVRRSRVRAAGCRIVAAEPAAVRPRRPADRGRLTDEEREIAASCRPGSTRRGGRAATRQRRQRRRRTRRRCVDRARSRLGSRGTDPRRARELPGSCRAAARR